MRPLGIAGRLGGHVTARAVQFLILFGITLGPACGPMPTKPEATVPVSGKVTDRLGRPIFGVDIVFFPSGGSLPYYYRPGRAATDSSGWYSAEIVAGTWDIRIFPPSNVGFDPYSYNSRATVSPERHRFDFTIDGFRVNGRVIGPTGGVVNDALVFADGGDPAYVSAETYARNDSFSLLLPPGSYTVVAVPRSPSGFPSRGLSDVVVRADTTFDIVLEGYLVTGAVYGPGGAPLESVSVTASGPLVSATSQTAVDGTYALYAPAGDYRFIIRPSGADSYIFPRISTVRTITGSSTIDFDLSGVEWTGTVRSSASLQPIEGVRTSAEQFGDLYYRKASATTDASGQFRLVLEPNREYSLTFTSSGTAKRAYPGFLAAADTTFDILLDPAPAP